MTPRQRAIRINQLRKELRRPSVPIRGKRMCEYERELFRLVNERLRDNLRGPAHV